MKIQTLLLAIFLSLTIVPTARGQSSLEKVVITYPSRSIASVDLYIAQERGFFRQEGILADVVQVRGNIGVTALLSGDAHAVNNVGTVIRAMERSDLPVKVVSQSLKKNLFWLVTKPEVKSLSELKGKLFGTTTFGGSQHLAALRLLQKAGLDPDKDITVVIGVNDDKLDLTKHSIISNASCTTNASRRSSTCSSRKVSASRKV